MVFGCSRGLRWLWGGYSVGGWGAGGLGGGGGIVSLPARAAFFSHIIDQDRTRKSPVVEFKVPRLIK